MVSHGVGQIRSYLGTKSTGTVEIQGLKDDGIKGLDVLLVEDIIDSGGSSCRILTTTTTITMTIIVTTTITIIIILLVVIIDANGVLTMMI